MTLSNSTIGALPAYVQISEHVIRQIAAGHLLDGERLPPERDMAKTFNVAVGTLRKALNLLADQGLIERRQGSGNYVRYGDHANTVYAFFRLELISGGGLPTAQMLSVDHLVKPDDAPNFGPSSMAFRFRRLRLLSDQPAALEEIWLDGDCAAEIDMQDISQSLYLFYKSKLNLWITRAEDKIGLAPVPDWTVDQFGLSAGAMAGFVERIAHAQTGNPIEYSRNWFNPDVARYISRLK